MYELYFSTSLETENIAQMKDSSVSFQLQNQLTETKTRGKVTLSFASSCPTVTKNNTSDAAFFFSP